MIFYIYEVGKDEKNLKILVVNKDVDYWEFIYYWWEVVIIVGK